MSNPKNFGVLAVSEGISKMEPAGGIEHSIC